MIKRRLLVGVLLLGLSLPALASDVRKHGAGLGYVRGYVDSDAFADEIDFDGFSVFGKLGFTNHWGLLFSYRDMDSTESSIDDKYTQFGVHGVYLWRPARKVRPHVKFGAVRTDFEANLVGVGTLTDDGVNFSVGGGLEAGTQRYAFYADLDYTEMDFILIDLKIPNLTLGVMFKF